jgi:hypothetical protein
MKTTRIAFGIAAATLAFAPAARANCRVHNDTKYSFEVASGHTSNQLVSSHTTTTIDAGKIIGKSKDGKSVGGFCRDGEEIEIKEDQGVPMIVPK